jgi:uncharacterized phage protein (TIGR02216 family)
MSLIAPEAVTLDWPGLLRAGLGELRLLPRDFWGLTPAELRLMLGRSLAVPPISRARLNELAAAYPDSVKGQADGPD